MARLVVQNIGENRIPVTADLSSTGWTISNGVMSHEKGIDGFAINLGVDIVAGESYKVQYEISEYSDGDVFIIVGGSAGITRNSSGQFEETITAISNGSISFFSNGNVSISHISVLYGRVNGQTLVFSEKGLKWVGSYAFVPDSFVRYKGLLFSFKEGAMYLHNENSIKNEFYGIKYPSKVRFISNKDYPVNKVFFGIKIDSVGAWQVDSIKTNKTDQFPNGMQSIVPKNNFSLDDGKYWADFFSDMNDPAFADITDVEKRRLMALNDGRKLQGNYLEIEMSCDSDKPMKLVSVSVYSIPVGRN